MAITVNIELKAHNTTARADAGDTRSESLQDGWLVSISVNGKHDGKFRSLRDPFLELQEQFNQRPDQLSLKEECRWYVEDYATKHPFARARAERTAKGLTKYASSLVDQLGLQHVVKAELAASTEDKASIVVVISEEPTLHHSVHSLHWELLEDPAFWEIDSNPEVQVLVKRVTDAPEHNSVLPPIHELKLDEPLSSSAQTVNGLLVVARNLSSDTDKVDISPTFAIDVLTKIQDDLAKHTAGEARLNLEVVRPGTIKALGEHLERATAARGKGHFHFVHFDLHGTVKAKKGQEPKAYLLFNNPDPAEAEPVEVPAAEAASIIAAHGVNVTIFNACESAKANSGDAANVAKAFLNKGIHNVLAMSYKLSSSAGGPFLRGLYQSLFLRGNTLSQAARDAREILRRDRDRHARLGLKRSVSDYFIPVLYTLGPDTKFVSPGPTKAREPIGFLSSLAHFDLFNFAWRQGKFQQGATDTDPPIGRAFDILRLEKQLIAQGRLHLTGRAGVGKSALLRHASTLWTRTSFVDVVVSVDFSKLKSVCAAVKSFLSQFGKAGNEFSSEMLELLQAPGFSKTEFDSLLAKALIPGQRLVLILDGLPYYQSESGNKSVDDGLVRFIEASIRLSNAQASRYVIAISRWNRRVLPVSELLQESLEKDVMTLGGLDIDDSVELSQIKLRTAGLDVDAWKDTEDREHKLLVQLLDGNPAAILHVSPLIVSSGKTLAEFCGLLQAGIPPEAHPPGGGKENLFREIASTFQSLDDEQRAFFLVLSVFWSEAVPMSYVTDWTFGEGVCQSQRSSIVVPDLKVRGLIDFEPVGKTSNDTADLFITWVHPLLTVYGRRVAYETLAKKQGKVGRSQARVATVVCSLLGTKLKEDHRLGKFHALRAGFFSWFLLGIQAVNAHNNLQHIVDLKEGFTFQKLLSMWPLQAGNLAVCLSLCLRLPVEVWPRDYFNFHVANLRIVGRPEHLEHYTRRFEELLGKLVGPQEEKAVEPRYLISALTIAVSLAATYGSEWPVPEQRAKYAKLALQIVRDTETREEASHNPNPFPASSRALYFKGLAIRQYMMHELNRGNLSEALEAARESLKIDESFAAVSAPNGGVLFSDSQWSDTRITELTDKIAPDVKTADSLKKRLEAMSTNTVAGAHIAARRKGAMRFIELSIEKEQSPKKTLSQEKEKEYKKLMERQLGDNLSGMGRINAQGNAMGLTDINVESGWYPKSSSMRRVIETRTSEDGRLDALDRAIGLGNMPRATKEFSGAIMSSLRDLDLDSTEEYLGGLVELSANNPLPGLEKENWPGQQKMINTLKKTLNLVCGTSYSEVEPKGAQNDAKTRHAAIADSVREEIKLLKQAKAPNEVIQAAELRLQTWLKSPDEMAGHDSVEEEAQRRENTRNATAIIVDNLRKPGYQEKLMAANLEFERLKARVTDAENVVKSMDRREEDGQEGDEPSGAKLYTDVVEALDAVQRFCERDGNEAFRAIFSDGYFDEAREPWLVNAAAAKVRRRFLGLLENYDFEAAKGLVHKFEADLDLKLRGSEQARKIVSGWLETVEGARSLVLSFLPSVRES